jgi:hypothetical protein
MKLLSGNSREAQDVGKAVRAHVHQLHTTYGMTYLVANSALCSVGLWQRWRWWLAAMCLVVGGVSLVSSSPSLSRYAKTQTLMLGPDTQ